MLKFLGGALGVYPIFYGLDRFVRPHMDAIGSHEGAHPVATLLEDIRLAERNIIEHINQTMRDINIALQHSTEEAILRPCINEITSTWSSVLTQSRTFGENSGTEGEALRAGYQRVSINIVTIFEHPLNLLQNTPNVEKTFQLLMNAWRCGLSVEALYLERQQCQDGPDAPQPDADKQIKNRYELYLKNLQSALVSACVDRMRSKNIPEAIKSFQIILLLERFGESVFSSLYRAVIDNSIEEMFDEAYYSGGYEAVLCYRTYRGSYEQELLKYIFNTYIKNNGITEEAEFIKLLLFIDQLPLTAQKIIAYNRIVFAYIGSPYPLTFDPNMHPNRHNLVLLAFLKRSIKSSTGQTPDEQACFEHLKNRIIDGAFTGAFAEYVFNEDKICLYNPWAAFIFDAGPKFAQKEYNLCFWGKETNPYLLYQAEEIFDKENAQPYVRFYNEKTGNYLDGGPAHGRHVIKGAEIENHHLQWRVTQSHIIRGHYEQLTGFFLQCRANGQYLAPGGALGKEHTRVCDDNPNTLSREKDIARHQEAESRERIASPREFGIFKSPKDVIPLIPHPENRLGRPQGCIIC